MAPRGRRWYVAFAVIALLGFLDNVAFSVVMPSVWGYLQKLGVASDEYWYLSLTMSMFSLVMVLAAPVVGFLADGRPMRPLIMVGLVIATAGHLLYATAWAPWVVVVSRAVIGLGDANMALLAVFLARMTAPAERTAWNARLNIFTEAGVLLGPAFALAFSSLDTRWGPFVLDPYTAPGWLMAVLCVINLLLVIFLLDEPPLHGVEPYSLLQLSAMQSSDSDDGESPALSDEDALLGGDGLDDESDGKARAGLSPQSRMDGVAAKLRAIASPATATVYCTQFVLFFNQTSMEAMLTPLTERLYDFGPLENSIIYFAIAALFMIMYAVIIKLSARAQDRQLIGTGVVLNIVSLSVCAFTATRADPPLWAFCVSVAVLAISLPFLFCCTASLLSKLVDPRHLGTAQGLLTATMNCGTLFGPLWAATLATQIWVPFVGTILAAAVLGGVLLLTYRHLDVSAATSTRKYSRADDE